MIRTHLLSAEGAPTLWKGAVPHLFSEGRLIFKEAPPEGPGEGKERKEKGEKKEGKEKKDKETVVEKETKKTGDQVKNVIPDAPPEPVGPRPVEGPQYVALPSIREGMKSVRNAALTVLGVAFPPLGIAGLATAGVGRYVKSKFGKEPLSMRQAAADTFIRAPKEGVKSVFKTILYPFHWTGAAGLNTLKFGGNRLYRALDATVFEFYRDLRTAVNYKFKLPEGTSLGASTMIGLKRMALVPRDLFRGYMKLWETHPYAALGLTVAVPWITASGAWPEVIGWVQNMAHGILRVVQGIGDKLGALPAGAPALPPVPH